MTLSSELARHVDAGVRSRGEAYFRRGSVEIEELTGDRVDAVVTGSAPYDVGLSIERDDDVARIFARCNCPYFESTGLCKHIWATVLAVERERSIPALDAAARIRLIDEDLAGDDDEDDEDSDIIGPPWFDDDDDDKDEAGRYDYDAPRFRDGGGGSRRPAAGGRASRPGHAGQRREARPFTWRDHLESIQGELASSHPRRGTDWHLLDSPSESQWIYVLDLREERTRDACVLHLFRRTRRRDGTWGEARPAVVRTYETEPNLSALDRRIASLLLGAEVNAYGGYFHSFREERVNEILIRPPILDTLVPLLAETGRFHLLDGKLDLECEPIGLDEGAPWEFRLKLDEDTARGGWILYGVLERDGARLRGLYRFAPGGWIFGDGKASRVIDDDLLAWRRLLDVNEALHIPEHEGDAFLERVYEAPKVPPIDWPPSLCPQEIRVTPHCHVRVSEDSDKRRANRLRVEVSYVYGRLRVLPAWANANVLEPESRRLYVRDVEAEAAAVARLRELGCTTPPAYVHRYDEARKQELELLARRLPEITRKLTAEGWSVEAHGRLMRPAGKFRLNVSSGIDWFDLEAELDFGDSAAGLPDLLAALKRGESWVCLDDGTCGMLPEEWLQKYGFLLRTGEVGDGKIRFRPYQVGLLDALLAEQPESSWDSTFEDARAALRKFDGIRPKKPPRSFKGTLRPYQEEGIGWLGFLQKFRFGGCLADDMGLGKTIQALALLDARRLELRRAQGEHRPSLVVVPRSLMFNWRAEAERFAPRLRVFDHVGPKRARDARELKEYDLVLTTYGTLRRDVLLLTAAEFDYVILDEAQAIKNADSASAKTARLLKADHRLALSGTPIENHLGELWSLFQFLNPGMLGTAAAFKAFSGRPQLESDAARRMLARAIRPFFLRRTKSQVAKDLPEKTEQTIFCDLSPRERRLYDGIRDHYRASLLGRIEKTGLGQSKIQVLEALLRLRQAACHPALIDRKEAHPSSAKLDVLLEYVTEVVEEGHKALVFSQFTSLLGLVRKELDERHISYEYLDGRTRRRAEKVEKFQSDPRRSLFLISLKAGGSGLNLTAAGYVFLLDPWWNPAVEAQAIDRTHRIGQTRPVFAYRLIAKDTVEEKVLELQKKKRDLADAIIHQNGNLLRELSREDLELLLS